MRIRLNAKFINRLIVLMLLVAPIIYLFGVLIAGLAGAHGTLDLTDLTGLFGLFFPDNFLSALGTEIVTDTTNIFGFKPFADLIYYVDANMLHFARDASKMGLTLYGFFYWSAHVLLLDLVFFAATFIIRFFKRIINKLEGDK